jgi:arylsulfatase A-like enzyme
MPRPDRRAFLKAAVSAAPAVLRARNLQPNVLLILADEWRAQSTGFSADTNLRTPVLDRLAAESATFTNAVSGTPVCCPYRASLMTGQYPLTNGVFINDVELKPNGATLGQVFEKAGYHTGYIGKWHLFGSPDGQYGRRLAYIPPEKRFGFAYWKACECTHDYVHSLYYEDDNPQAKYWPGYDAFAQTDDACAFIGRQSHGRDPFFLVLSLGPPHFPLDSAPARYRAQFEKADIRLRPNVPADKRESATADLRGYYAHMLALDECLARLLETLDHHGLAEDTILVFTSDHGDMMFSQGLTTKLHPWDESIRVPFLVRYPRRLGRRSRKLPVLLNAPDIMPTLLRFAGLPVPDSVEGQDGFQPVRGASSALLGLPVPITEARRYGFAAWRGLRTPRYTYVRSIHGPWLLYDNHADPYQMHNLCGKSGERPLQQSLDRLLTVRLRERHDDFMPAAEYVKRAGVAHYREVTMPAGHCRSPWGDWESTLQPGE